MDEISARLSTISGRDKYLALGQFVPMIFAGPIGGNLGQSLTRISAVTGDARALNRFTLLADGVFNKGRLEALSSMPHGLWRAVAYAEFFFDALFCPMEHISFLARHGIIANPNDRAGRLGNMATFCWFWSLFFKTATVIHELSLENSRSKAANRTSSDLYRANAVRRLRLTLLKLVSFLLLAWSFLPKGGVKLLVQPVGPFAIVHKTAALMSFPRLEVSDVVRGVLGTVATAVDFL
jgi:hypothetical protein